MQCLVLGRDAGALIYIQINICLFDFPDPINQGWQKQIKEWLSSLHRVSRSPLMCRKGRWGRVIWVDANESITDRHVYSSPNGSLF